MLSFNILHCQCPAHLCRLAALSFAVTVCSSCSPSPCYLHSLRVRHRLLQLPPTCYLLPPRVRHLPLSCPSFALLAKLTDSKSAQVLSLANPFLMPPQAKRVWRPLVLPQYFACRCDNRSAVLRSLILPWELFEGQDQILLIFVFCAAR